MSVAIDDVNTYIRSLESKGVFIFNAYEILADDKRQVQVEYSADLLHLNAAGYEALNEALVPVLLEIK